MQDYRQKPSDIPLLRQKQVMADYSPIRWICRGICTRNGIADAPIPACLQACMISLLFLPIFCVHVCMTCCTRGEQRKIVFPVTMQRIRKLATWWINPGNHTIRFHWPGITIWNHSGWLTSWWPFRDGTADLIWLYDYDYCLCMHQRQTTWKSK